MCSNAKGSRNSNSRKKNLKNSIKKLYAAHLFTQNNDFDARRHLLQEQNILQKKILNLHQELYTPHENNTIYHWWNWIVKTDIFLLIQNLFADKTRI